MIKLIGMMYVNQGENKMTNDELVLEINAIRDKLGVEFKNIREEHQILDIRQDQSVNNLRNQIKIMREKLEIELNDNRKEQTMLNERIQKMWSTQDQNINHLRNDLNTLQSDISNRDFDLKVKMTMLSNQIDEIKNNYENDMEDVREDTNYSDDIREIRNNIREINERIDEIVDDQDEEEIENRYQMSKSNKDRLPWDEYEDESDEDEEKYLRDDLLKRVELDVYHFERGDEDLTIRDILMEWAHSLQEVEEYHKEDVCCDDDDNEKLRDIIRQNEFSISDTQKTLRQIRKLWNLTKDGSRTQKIEAEVELEILIDGMILPEPPITHNRRKYDCR